MICMMIAGTVFGIELIHQLPYCMLGSVAQFEIGQVRMPRDTEEPEKDVTRTLVHTCA